MVNYVVILLLPAMLTATDVGFTQPAASRALRDVELSAVSPAPSSARSSFSVSGRGSRCSACRRGDRVRARAGRARDSTRTTPVPPGDAAR